MSNYAPMKRYYIKFQNRVFGEFWWGEKKSEVRKRANSFARATGDKVLEVEEIK